MFFTTEAQRKHLGLQCLLNGRGCCDLDKTQGRSTALGLRLTSLEMTGLDIGWLAITELRGGLVFSVPSL